MFTVIEKIILAMAGLRILSGLIELTAGFLILRLNDVEKALMVNAFLAVVGPLIFISSMSLGILHLAEKISYSKLLLIGLGVGFIILGLRK
ncbi:YqhV family protein [Caldalkalibacillus mannanilyticus]|uniref:YqhV family protein n=1 Tax=Caldalkalibacillus mannanilyticus TaxID=1418 RepID=UPI0009DDF5B0|nr:YqhV family protein [Caldalkalibacillus mannanilyticus]